MVNFLDELDAKQILEGFDTAPFLAENGEEDFSASGGGLLKTDQDVQGAMGKGKYRDAQVFAQQMGGASPADDNLDAVANHFPGQGNGVIQSLGIDKNLILLPGGQDLHAFDQGVAGREDTDPDFFLRHNVFPGRNRRIVKRYVSCLKHIVNWL